MSSFILSLFLLASNVNSPKITIEAGETETIDIPSESSVEVNPKKILEIEAAGKGKLRLIALKSGVVLIKASSPQGEKSWLVEVLGRDQQSDWLLRSEWQSYFCSKNGIQCDLENKVISGESDDLQWFYEARQTCKKKMPCSWEVVISEAARTKAVRDIKPILGGLSFDVTADGQVLIDSYCDDADKKLMDKALANLNESFKVVAQIRCLERAPDVYLLDVLVVAERKGSGEISNPLQWERIELPSKQPLHAFIAELSQNSKLRIVAQPELSLSMGGTAMLRDGQEIQTHAIQKDTEEILWKTSGFRLDLKLIEIKAGLARIQMKMNLSQPQAGLRTIDASEFQTEVWIPSHALQRVGRMQATLEGTEENRIPWLSAIPLLGALFRWESVTDSKSQIDIFLRIRPASIESMDEDQYSTKVPT